MSARASLLDRVHDLAEELHGRGVALSVDPEPGSRGSWRVRLWDRAGLLIEETEPGRRDQAVRDMMRRLTS